MSLLTSCLFPRLPVVLPIPILSPEDVVKLAKLVGMTLYGLRCKLKESGRNYARSE